MSKQAAKKPVAPKAAKPARKPAPAPKAAPTFIATSHVNNAVFSIEKPGLLAYLYETLYHAAPSRGGSGKTKAELLAGALANKSFVARYNGDEELAGRKMKVTISAQVPSQHKSERGYIVKTYTRPDGTLAYYIDSEASEAYLCGLLDLIESGAPTPINADNIVKRPLPWAPTTKDGKARLKWRGAPAA